MMGDDFFNSFPGSSSEGSGGGGLPGTVTSFSDRTIGLQTSSNFTSFSSDSKKDDPGCYTSPDGNISIKVRYGDEDWEDLFEGLGQTGGGGFGDTDLGSGRAPPREAGARGPDGLETYDKEAWGETKDPQFRNRADGEAGGGWSEPAVVQAMNARGQGAPAWTG